MEFLNCYTIEELKKHGKLYELGRRLKEYIGTGITIKANSWNALLESIKALRKVNAIMENPSSKLEGDEGVENASSQLENNEGIENPSSKLEDDEERGIPFFKSENDEVVFYLTQLDGKDRLDKLGVSIVHYSDKKLANKWRNSILKKIHPDKWKDGLGTQATAELNNIYKEMC